MSAHAVTFSSRTGPNPSSPMDSGEARLPAADGSVPTPAIPDSRFPIPDATPFAHAFDSLFALHFERIRRYLDRLTGDRDLASDLAQETFVRLFRRGSLPDDPAAWLITVALNQFRNAATQRSRRRSLLSVSRGRQAHSDPPLSPDDLVERADERDRVRLAVDGLPERDRHLLLLSAEGFSYRELAAALGLHEPSVGTLLARARSAFRAKFQEISDAS